MSSGKTNKVDEVLKLPGGEAFDTMLNELLVKEPENDHLIIALMDVDSFLRVNEQFGYEAGDQVLIAIGSHLKEQLPEDAILFRLKGDEFGVIFNGDREKEDVFLLMEKIRSTLSVTLPDGENMTLSIGIAAAFDDAGRYYELVRKAEGAMFRAKQNGRDRIALAREEKMVTKTSHYTQDQLQRLTKLSKQEGIGEAILLREALDMLLQKYTK